LPWAALCICPTRELVVQNVSVLERMSKFTSITCATTAGGDYEKTRRERIVDQVQMFPE
jgi:ATP-dependent RNA helicase DDX19/DBP5